MRRLCMVHLAVAVRHSGLSLSLSLSLSRQLVLMVTTNKCCGTLSGKSRAVRASLAMRLPGQTTPGGTNHPPCFI